MSSPSGYIIFSVRKLKFYEGRINQIPPFGWLTLKTSLLRGIIKFTFFLKKIEYGGELRISDYKSVHLTNADRKKELRKKLFLTLNWKITKF